MQAFSEITDCHIHFIDNAANEYSIFKKFEPGFAEFFGDYSALPKIYLPPDYFIDTKGYSVVKTVAAEFISTDPLKEATWLQTVSNMYGHPHGIIARIEFLWSNVRELLDAYSELSAVTTIREHLFWHPHQPLKSFATRAHILQEEIWQKHFKLIRDYRFNFECEIYGHQIPDFIKIARLLPETRMILAPMGYPLDLSSDGRKQWQKNLRELSQCENVFVKITAIECVFGLRWNIEEVKPWVRDIIDIFGSHRCMFASHMPLTRLSYGFKHLYESYYQMVSDLPLQDQLNLASATAQHCYRV